MSRTELTSILRIMTMAARHRLPMRNLGEAKLLQMRICLLLSKEMIL